MQPENEPMLNFDQLSHCSRLFLIFTLFYLPTFEGFRILLLSFALLFFSLLLFLFCVVFLYKKNKGLNYFTFFSYCESTLAPIEFKIKYCLATCARNGRFLQIFWSSGRRGFVEGSLLRGAGEVTQSLKLPYLL